MPESTLSPNQGLWIWPLFQLISQWQWRKEETYNSTFYHRAVMRQDHYVTPLLSYANTVLWRSHCKINCYVAARIKLVPHVRTSLLYRSGSARKKEGRHKFESNHLNFIHNRRCFLVKLKGIRSVARQRLDTEIFYSERSIETDFSFFTPYCWHPFLKV